MIDAISQRVVIDGDELLPGEKVEIAALVGALLLEQNNEWAEQRARHMTLETIGQMSDDALINLQPWRAHHPAHAGKPR